MSMQKVQRAFCVAVVSVLCACGGGDGQAVVDETRTLAEGAILSYTLEAGTYTAEVTASSNGVKVAWVGGTGCSTSGEVKTYTGSCTLTSKGQLTVTNPTLLSLGASEITTVLVKKH